MYLYLQPLYNHPLGAPLPALGLTVPPELNYPPAPSTRIRRVSTTGSAHVVPDGGQGGGSGSFPAAVYPRQFQPGVQQQYTPALYPPKQ